MARVSFWRTAAALLAIGGMIALPAIADASARPPTPASVSVAAGTSTNLSITMQVQQQDEWCWSASGVTVLAYEGKRVSQNSFCAGARGLPAGYQCPNQPASSSDIVNGLAAQGASSTDVGDAIDFPTVQSQIDGNRPFIVAIAWTAGGGHAEVGYGYDASSQTMSVGDPWPTDQRYTTYNWSDFLQNSQFTWFDTIANISAGGF
ncbi:hypothetical protein F0L68_01330 [Solihabitans fulvus]|uniref:Papain like cysteine protease AvrRpt2 n=1 Tax=Solihabitans fulvus TaxID=1892852 RepID=A0A5B2XWZ8_9PSEU|nr:papain-like cysteine protease family protein [Solihabitans fulvus]KAA2267191.1 hypothetical protein F0L68_01330 [Solihabitans fulvus]